MVERAYSSLLCTALPIAPRARNGAPRVGPGPVAGSSSYQRKAARGRFYRETQRSYEKDRSKLLKEVLQGTWGADDRPIPTDEIFGFWSSIFQKESVQDNRHPVPARNQIMEVVRPIEVSELDAAIKNSTTTAAAGPDGRTLADIGAKQAEVVKYFNLWLLAGSIPAELLEGITTLIPKIVGPCCS